MSISTYVRDICICGEKIWFIPNKHPFLIVKDTISSDVSLVTRFESKDGECDLFDKITYDKKNNILVLTPLVASEIVVYKIDTGELLRIGIEDKHIKQLNFCGGYVIDRFLFMFGVLTPVIARFNLDSFDVDYIDEWYETIDSELKGLGIYYMTRQVTYDRGMLIAPMRNAKCIIEIDPYSLKWSVIPIRGEFTSGFGGIIKYKDTYICSPSENNEKRVLLFLNEQYKVEKSIYIMEKDTQHDELVGIGVFRDSIYLFGVNNGVVNYDDENGEVIVVKDSLSQIYECDSHIYYYNNKTKKIVSIEDNEYLDITISTDIIRDNCMCIMEDDMINLEDYLCLVRG